MIDKGLNMVMMKNEDIAPVIITASERSIFINLHKYIKIENKADKCTEDAKSNKPNDLTKLTLPPCKK